MLCIYDTQRNNVDRDIKPKGLKRNNKIGHHRQREIKEKSYGKKGMKRKDRRPTQGLKHIPAVICSPDEAGVSHSYSSMVEKTLGRAGAVYRGKKRRAKLKLVPKQCGSGMSQSNLIQPRD